MPSNQESEIKKQLAELPGRNQQCDVILQIGLSSFMANKDVLTLRMDYFRGMFNANMQEKDQVFIKLDPAIVDPAVFGDILGYVYTLNITLTTAKLESIYKAADFFCFDELKAKTEHFMKSNIVMDNVTCIIDIAAKFNLKDLEETCKLFITSNPLLHPTARRAVGYLNYEELSTLLRSQHNLAKFEEMFHSSIAWILHDEQNRSEKILDLLQKIPLGRLSSDFHKNVISKNTILMNDNKCLQLLYKSVINPPVEDLYVFGGSDGDELSSMSKYDSSTSQWIELEPMPGRVSHFGCAVVDQEIYVCGGTKDDEEIKELFKFDTNTRKWTSLKPMKHRRRDCAMAVLDGHLYVAGGSYVGEYSIVERYSIQNDEWEKVSPMLHPREGLELVEMNGFLYALGGHDVTRWLTSVEQYNPQTGKWTTVANMNNWHVYFGSAVLNNRIYVVGRDSFEEYNPEVDKWRIMTSPTECDFGRRLAAFEGKLYATGGMICEMGKWKGIKTVEYYDFEKQTWTAEKDINIGRGYHGVAVVTRKCTPE